jgi:hypothetical protein
MTRNDASSVEDCLRTVASWRRMRQMICPLPDMDRTRRVIMTDSGTPSAAAQRSRSSSNVIPKDCPWPPIYLVAGCAHREGQGGRHARSAHSGCRNSEFRAAHTIPVVNGNLSITEEHLRGWVDGRNVHIDYRWGAGSVERLQVFAKALVRLNPEVLLALTTPATAALQREKRTIPIVFAIVFAAKRPSLGYSGNSSAISKRNCQSPGVLMLPGPARRTL